MSKPFATVIGDAFAGLGGGPGAVLQRQAFRREQEMEAQAQQQAQELQAGRATLIGLVEEGVAQGLSPQQAISQAFTSGALTDVMAADPKFIEHVAQLQQTLTAEQPKPVLAGPGSMLLDPESGLPISGFAPPFKQTPDTQINIGGGPQVGSIPPGYVLRPEPDGSFRMELIPGSPQAQEAASGAQLEEQRASQRAAHFGFVRSTIDQAIGQANGWTAGLGSLTAVIPGTPAADLAATLDTIAANIGFEQLQAMRAASPTGAALGAVSDNENALLQAVLGSVKASQSPLQLRANLRRLKEQLLRVVHGPEEAERLIQQEVARDTAREEAQRDAGVNLEAAIEAGDAEAVNRHVAQLTPEQLRALPTHVLNAIAQILGQQ